MASTIHNIMPKIVLSSENLSELSKSTNLENVIKMALFHNANESFQALASLISFGTSSPSKKSRKALRSDLFGKIAYETFPIKNHGNIKLSHMEIATGLQSLSDRWARYSFDELLSLVMLIDVNGKGSLSVDDFVVFTDLVDGVVNKVGPHEEQLAKLYDSLKTKLLLTSADGKVSMKVREKIVVLGNEARYLHQTPLTMLCAALEENGSHSANELLVEFVESLAAFVAAQRDALGVQQEKGKAAQSNEVEEQEEVNDEVEAEGAIEIDDSTFVNVDEDEEQEELGDNNSRSGDSGIDSGSDSEEEGVAEFNESDVDFSPQPQSQADSVVEQDIAVTANNASFKERSAASTHTAETPSTRKSSTQSASTTDNPTTLRSTKPNENESAAVQGSQPLDASPQAKEALLRTLDAFQTNAQLISANLSSYDRRLQSSEDMWAQLQQMERDLRAAQDLFKRVVRRPAGDNDTAEVVATTSRPSHSHYGSVGEATAAGDNHSARVASNVATVHHDVHHRHSHTPSSGHPNSQSSDHNYSRSSDHSSLRTPMIKTKSSGNLLYTPEPTNISSINNHLNTTTGHSTMVSGAVGGRSVSPSGVHSFSSSTGGRFFTPASEGEQTPQMRHSAEALAVKSLQNSYKNKVNLTVNVRPGAKAASDKPSEARISQFTAPPVRTDLSIFKSPIKRQAHGNRNVSKAGEGWQRTAQLTNKYNERFQTCADLRFASKVNAVFYNPK